MSAWDKQKKYALIGRTALIITTLIWGSSFVILKNTLNSVSTPYVLAFRFTGAAILMALMGVREFKKLDRKYFAGGVLMGANLFAAYMLQTYGLEYTAPGVNAFLTSTYCVIVPFLGWIFCKRRPDRFNISAAIICIAGVGLVSLQGGYGVGLGEALTTACGLFYALHILVTSRYIEGRSPILLTMIQFSVCGILAWTAALFTDPLPTQIPTDAVLSILYLTVMCTGVCFLFQTIGQKYTDASAAAVIMTLESVLGVLFSIALYGERPSPQMYFGFALIFIAVLISETKLSFLHFKQKKEAIHVQAEGQR